MITNPVSFSENQKSKIDFILSSELPWTDDEVSELRSYIKSHYLTTQYNQCPYCRQVIKTEDHNCWHVEHIVSIDENRKFMFTPINLCVSCPDCNKAKSNKKVTTSNAKIKYPSKNTFRIIHPHFDDHNAHIATIKPGLFYLARTEKGRLTIEYCNLLRFYKYITKDGIDSAPFIFGLTESLKYATDENMRESIKKELLTLLLEDQFNKNES